MLIFGRWHHSKAVVAPVKYVCDIHLVKSVMVILIKWKNNGTEKNGLVTPTSGPLWKSMYHITQNYDRTVNCLFTLYVLHIYM